MKYQLNTQDETMEHTHALPQHSDHYYSLNITDLEYYNNNYYYYYVQDPVKDNPV